MHFKFALIIVFAGLILLSSSCGGNPEVNNGIASKSNVSNLNSNGPRSGASSVDTTKKTTVETSNNAPATSTVVKAYFDALRSKNDAALLTVLSSQYIKTISSDMKKEKKTSMSSYLAEYDGVSDKPIEVRNENIDGEKAVVEIKGANFLNWTPFILVKEGGAWKWTGQSPDLDSVKQAPLASSPGR